MHNITVVDLARQVKIVRGYQKLYQVQKGIAKKSCTPKDFAAAGRTLITANLSANALDNMVEQVLLAGEEGIAA